MINRSAKSCSFSRALQDIPLKPCHRLLLQKPFGSLHLWISVKPSLHHVLVKYVSQGEQAHSLMMGHPATYEFVGTLARRMGGDSVICCIAKTVVFEPAFFSHSMQVVQRGGGIYRQRK